MSEWQPIIKKNTYEIPIDDDTWLVVKTWSIGRFHLYTKAYSRISSSKIQRLYNQAMTEVMQKLVQSAGQKIGIGKTITFKKPPRFNLTPPNTTE